MNEKAKLSSFIILCNTRETAKKELIQKILYWRNKIKLGGAGYIYNRPPGRSDQLHLWLGGLSPYYRVKKPASWGVDQGADTCRPGLLVNIVDMRCMAVWNKMYLFPGRQELHGRTLYYININIIMFKCSVIFLRMEFVNDSFHVGCRSRFIDTISCINNTIIPQCHIRLHGYIRR